MADFLNDMLASVIQQITATLPKPNPLLGAASYDYVLGIGILSDAQVNNPDNTYLQGDPYQLIAKTANVDPDNRVATAYGSTNFYIENLEMESVVAFQKGHATNVTKFTFDIIEPYSMGQFMMACQYGASHAGHTNWTTAPFLLTISFRGSTESGTMSLIPGTSRYIPFKLNDVKMQVTEGGATYKCSAVSWADQAHDNKYARMRTDVAINGSTIQEMLQTGENSLQNVINKTWAKRAADNSSDPDQILILFPTDVSSGTGSTGGTSATTASALYQKLGVTATTASDNSQLLSQSTDQCNKIGQASMGYDEIRKGTPATKKEVKVWDPKHRVEVRAFQTAVTTEGLKQYSQGQSIYDVITDVIVTSDYAKTMLTSDPSSTGMRNWFRIDTQVYNMASTKNATVTGTKPQLIVYRVIPYQVHVSSAPVTPNTQPPGYNELVKQAVKQYNYLYTGKNADIIKFDINFNAGFRTPMPADLGQRTDDKVMQRNTGDTIAKNQVELIAVSPDADVPVQPIVPNQTFWGAIGSRLDHGRGANDDTEITRTARWYHQYITQSLDMMELDMEIIGDPYYIAQSGMGNYTATPSNYANLSSDGESIFWQNGEVDIVINFRSPIDLNQSTGLYDFPQKSKTLEVLQFNGLYKVLWINSYFKGGQFTQKLHLQRRRNQESDAKASAANTMNAKTPDPAAAYGGSNSSQEQSGT